jgi:23S rRNA (guanosine2251-2'-O)-methyltransferase
MSRKSDDSPQEQIIFGIRPVQEALRSEAALERIYVSEGRRGQALNDILSQARTRHVDVRFEPWERLNARVGKHDVHQGVVALAAAYAYVEFEEVLAGVQRADHAPLLLLLDQIQDPHNLGAILRSAECAGVHGVILPRHKASAVTPAALKVSAGAAAYLPICRVTNLATAIDQLKQAGFWIAGAADKGARAYTDVDFTVPTAIVIGNEEKGLRRLIAAQCDVLTAIPLHGKISSLNASVAAGILLFEVCRQRQARQCL